MGRQGLDDDQVAAMAAGACERVLARESVKQVGPGQLRQGFCVRGFGGAEKFPAESDVRSAMAVGKEAKVANANEAVGEDMEKKSPDEFDGIERHRSVPTAVLVVFPAEGDFAVV